MNKRGLVYLLLALLCSWRAFQLYWSSTQVLRSAEKHSWFPYKKKEPFNDRESVLSKLRNDSIILGAEPSNIFYFLHVTEKH